MPKATVKCLRCNEEFVGELPDISRGRSVCTLNSFEGWGRDLVGKLMNHHNKSASERIQDGTLNGHKWYAVFLEGGGGGKIEVRSRYVGYSRDENDNDFKRSAERV